MRPLKPIQITLILCVFIAIAFARSAVLNEKIIGTTGVPINTGCIPEQKDNSNKPVFLPTQHTKKQPVPAKDVLFHIQKSRMKFGPPTYEWVRRPFETPKQFANFFNMICNLTPNDTASITNDKNTNKNKNNNIFLMNDMAANNSQFTLLMNKEYRSLLNFVLTNNMNCPLYIFSDFETSLNPEMIRMSKGAIQIMTEENAGGQSELSEGFSFEVLFKCFNAKLLKTEMQIKYWWNSWKKTDYSVNINEFVIGVSVTRAMKYNGLFNKYDAHRLLHKKLYGINESSRGVLERDEWQRQILHIWATDEYVEQILKLEFQGLLLNDPELCANTIVIVTVASPDMWWLFYQDKYFQKMNKKTKSNRKKNIKKDLLISRSILTAVM